MNLTPSNIHIGIDKEYWLITQRQKTDTDVKVPLLPQVENPATLTSVGHNNLAVNSRGGGGQKAWIFQVIKDDQLIQGLICIE